MMRATSQSRHTAPTTSGQAAPAALVSNGVARQQSLRGNDAARAALARHTLSVQEDGVYEVAADAAGDHGNADRPGSLAWTLAGIDAHRDAGTLTRGEAVTVALGAGEFKVRHAVELVGNLDLHGVGEQDTRLVWHQPAALRRPEAGDSDAAWAAWADESNQNVLLGEGISNVTIERLSVKGREQDREATRALREEVGEAGFWNTNEDGALASPEGARMTGIHISGKEGRRSSNITIQDTRIADCGRYGIGMGRVDGVRLRRTDLADNGSSAAFDHNAYLRNVNDVRVRKLDSHGAGGAGLKVADADDTRIAHSRFHGNGTDGVRLANTETGDEAAGTVLDDVRACGNGRDGVHVSAETVDGQPGKNGDVTVRDSTMRRNDRHGLSARSFAPGRGLTRRHNRIRDNGAEDVDVA